MNLHWPQITTIALLCLEGGITLAKHGLPRENYNFTYKLIDAAVLLPLLYFGGFFLGNSP